MHRRRRLDSGRRAAPPRPCAAPRDRARGVHRAGAQPRARRPVDARHLVGHRVGGDAAGLRQRLQPGARCAASAARSATAWSIVWPGQTSMQAGGERAGRRIRLQLSRRRARSPSCRSSSREPRVHAATCPMAWGTKQAHLPGPRRRARLRAHAHQRAAAGRFLDAEDVRLQRRVVSSAARWRARCSATSPPVGQRVRISGMAFEVVGVQKEKVQISNYLRPDKESRLHPVHDRRAAVEHRVHHADGLPGGGPDAGGAGDRAR